MSRSYTSSPPPQAPPWRVAGRLTYISLYFISLETSYFVFFFKYYYSNEINKDEMCGACSTEGELRNSYETTLGKPEGKRSLGRYRRRREVNIKMGLEVVTGSSFVKL
jgi:hypothetical protein